MRIFYGFLLALAVFSQSIAGDLRLTFFQDKFVTVVCPQGKQTFFTIGHHSPDSTFGVIDGDSVTLTLGDFGRQNTSAHYKSLVIYNPTSALVPSDSGPVNLIVKASERLLFYQGRLYQNFFKVSVPNNFVLREFPIVICEKNKFFAAKYPLNQTDSVKVFFFWADSAGKALLPFAQTRVKSAVAEIGKIAPSFWHKNLQHWAGVDYSLVVFLGTNYIGLEHFNCPYVGLSKRYLYSLEELAYHEMLHSFLGKSIMPETYMMNESFHPTDVLWWYEGLTSLLGNRFYKFRPDFVRDLTWRVSRANFGKLFDLREVSLRDRKEEGYYEKGMMFWISIWEKIDLEKWLSWLFEIKLKNRKVPIPANSDSIFFWLNEYKPGVGDYARELAKGSYLDSAEKILEFNGWRRLLFKDSDYNNSYIGPYYYAGGYKFYIDTLGIPLDYKFVGIIDEKNDTIPFFGSGNSGYKRMMAKPDSIFRVIMKWGKVSKVIYLDKFSLDSLKDKVQFTRLVIAKKELKIDNKQVISFFRVYPDTAIKVRIEYYKVEKVLLLKKNMYFPNGKPFFWQGDVHFGKIPLKRREKALSFWRKLCKR